MRRSASNGFARQCVSDKDRNEKTDNDKKAGSTRKGTPRVFGLGATLFRPRG